MSRAFQVGDKVELVEGIRGIKGRQFGVPYTVVGVSSSGFSSVQINGGTGVTGNEWFGAIEVRLWWSQQPTVIVGESTVQDSSRGVFLSLELESDELAESHVKVYDDVLSALKDSNGTNREVFFVPYPTAKAGRPVWEAVA